MLQKAGVAVPAPETLSPRFQNRADRLQALGKGVTQLGPL